MKSILFVFAVIFSASLHAQSLSGEVLASASGTIVKNVQPQPKKKLKAVIVTGVRFAYPLVQHWIDEYNKTNPGAEVIIESRGTNDPAQYDILVEAYDQSDEMKKTREYQIVARYAILPVANSKSEFSKVYTDKGLNKDLINQLFFHDLYSDKKELELKVPYTVYTRLQKAGVPIVFTKYFGFQQKDIKGKAIAGADEHLLKAVLRDSIAVSYLPLSLIYDQASKKPVAGLTVLPVDFNGNGRINDDEKFYGDVNSVITHLESSELKSIHNIPIEPLHLSIDKNSGSPEAQAFLKWVAENGQKDLHEFGFLKAEQTHVE